MIANTLQEGNGNGNVGVKQKTTARQHEFRHPKNRRNSNISEIF